MNKRLVSIVIIMVWVIGLRIGSGVAQADPTGPPPNIKVTLALDKDTYLPGEPILVTLALENKGDPLIMAKEFTEGDYYHLLLQFFDESGKVITSDSLNPNALTPPPPRVFPADSGVIIQGTLVEEVETGWVLSFEPYDAYDFYPLEGRSGLIGAKAVVPARTFWTYQETSSGIRYAKIFPLEEDQTKWAGSLNSNIVSFTKVYDADGDGYYYPTAYGDTQPYADCDDGNPEVRPGVPEILGDGVDNDCDPNTPDVEYVPEVKDGTIRVRIVRLIKGGESQPDSTINPCVGAYVRAYEMSAGSCVLKNHGLFKHKYKSIWLSNLCQPEGAARADAEGMAQVGVAPGNYLVLGVYDPDGELDYDGDEVYKGVVVGGVKSEQTVDRNITIKE
jgi:hypothetical protein